MNLITSDNSLAHLERAIIVLMNSIRNKIDSMINWLLSVMIYTELCGICVQRNYFRKLFLELFFINIIIFGEFVKTFQLFFDIICHCQQKHARSNEGSHWSCNCSKYNKSTQQLKAKGNRISNREWSPVEGEPFFKKIYLKYWLFGFVPAYQNENAIRIFSSSKVPAKYA